MHCPRTTTLSRFAYYDRLSRRDQRTYRLSDAVGAIELDEPAAFAGTVDRLRAALAAGRRLEVERAAGALCDQVTEALNVTPTSCRVLDTRPRERSGAELHGMYTPFEDGSSLIEVWMRTAARGDVVAFRTFLRTLVHELCHHLDYELLELENTFHTPGFFQRESSLFRQLVGEAVVLS